MRILYIVFQLTSRQNYMLTQVGLEIIVLFIYFILRYDLTVPMPGFLYTARTLHCSLGRRPLIFWPLAPGSDHAVGLAMEG